LDKKIIQQYKELEIPVTTLNRINNLLELPNDSLNKLAEPKRYDTLDEALSWDKGPNQENRITTEIYHIQPDYTVAIGKPGKEAAPDYKGCRFYAGERKGEKTNNPNDMNPHILKSGEKVGKDLTFEDMFEKIEKLMQADMFGLEIMGMLFFRDAFMLDHEKNGEGKWRYSPPKEILDLLEKRIPKIDGIPTRVLLYFLEVLGLNEDIKVYTLGYTNMKQSYGRINTLLTFSHLVAVFLHRRSLARFAGTFARPPSGMAPLPKTKVNEYYPLLTSEWSQGSLDI